MAAAIAGTGAGRRTLSIHASGRDGAAANGPDGFRRAARLMEEAGAGRAVAEATGRMRRAPPRPLRAGGIDVCVTDPRRPRDSARASGEPAKTGRAGARVLAAFMCGRSRRRPPGSRSAALRPQPFLPVPPSFRTGSGAGADTSFMPGWTAAAPGARRQCVLLPPRRAFRRRRGRRPCGRNGGRRRPPGPEDARRALSGPQEPSRAAGQRGSC